MTIATTSNKATWQGNGSTTVFPFVFEVGSASEITLYLSSASGSVSTIPSSSYSVSGLGDPSGGTITYPLSGAPIATGSSLTLVRTVPLRQLTDLSNQSNYFPDAVEGALDYLMMAIQQIASQVANAIQTPLSDPPLNLTLPAAAGRALTLAGFDANGNSITYPVPASVGAGILTNEGPFVAGTNFTAGTTTTLTLSKAYGTPANLDVHFVSASAVTYVGPDQYSLNGNQVIFNSPIPTGTTKVYIVGGTTLSAYIPAQGSVGIAQLQWGNSLGRVVDSIASLRALSSSTFTRAFATGYSGASDGGGGPYQLNPSDTTSADNGVTIIVATDGGRWYLQHNGTVCFKQCGGREDGVTDDLAAWNRALALCGSSSVGSISELVFSGTSVVSGQVSIQNSNTSIRGMSRNARILAQGGKNFQYVLYGSALSNIQLRNFTVDANQQNRASVLTTTGYCVLLTGCSGCVADGMIVQNSIGYGTASAVGFQLGGSGSNNIIRNSFALNCGIAGRASDGFYCSNDYSLLEGNTSENCFDTGHVLEACNYSTIAHCRSIGCSVGAAISNFLSTNVYGNQIVGLTVRDWNSAVVGGLTIQVAGSGNLCDTTITGLSMTVSVNGTGPAINFYQPSSGIINGLRLDCSVNGGSTQGILVNGQNIAIKANVSGVALDCIQVQTGANILISGCVLNGGQYGITTRGSAIACAQGNYCYGQSLYGLYAYSTSTLTSLMNTVVAPSVSYEGKDAGATLNRMTLVGGTFSINSLFGSVPTGTLNNKFNVVDQSGAGKGVIPMYTA